GCCAGGAGAAVRDSCDLWDRGWWAGRPVDDRAGSDVVVSAVEHLRALSLRAAAAACARRAADPIEVAARRCCALDRGLPGAVRCADHPAREQASRRDEIAGDDAQAVGLE